MKKKISTDKAPAAIGPYSQGIETENLIFLSGQIPLDPETMKLACVALICHSSINTGIQPATVKNGVYNSIRATKTKNMALLSMAFHSNCLHGPQKLAQTST